MTVTPEKSAEDVIKMIKVADYIINTLAAHGIDKIAVLYGAANGDLIDAFTRTDKTEYLCFMHEQGGGFAAEGYAKIKGVPGVMIATSGPGGGNCVTSIQNCFYDSVPVIFLTGQINSKFLRPNEEIRQIGFQETPIVEIVRPITKYATMIRDPQRVRYELGKALHLCRTGRPGPVLLDIPIDVQKALIEPDDLEFFDVLEAGNAPSQAYLPLIDHQIDQFMKDLVRAERPVMLIGGGVRSGGAENAFRQVAEKLKIPCFPTWNGCDVVTSDFAYYGGRIGTYGGAGRNFGIQNSDLLLSVGSRISGRITGGNPTSFARGAKKYLVDVDAALLKTENQQVPFDENIHCNAALFFHRLAHRLDDYQPRNGEWLARCIEWRDKYDPVTLDHWKPGHYVDPYAFMRLLSTKVDANAVIVADSGGNLVTCMHAFETKWGQRLISSNGNSPIGFSFAGAMGAWFANPDRQIICIIGDGGMIANIQEIQTVINYGAKVKTFILENRIYGITKAYQETNFEGRAEACGPKGYRPPDFIKVAKGFGIDSHYINRETSIDASIQHVLDHDKAMICVVNCFDHHTYEPRLVGWDTPIEDMTPKLPREEFRANMIVPPVEGWDK